MGQSLPKLNLNTNKNLKDVLGITVRQTEKGGLIEAAILNEDGSPYDLTNMSVTFQDHKTNNKWISDDKVTVKDAKNGLINYTLHDQAYAGKGVAWFEMNNAQGTKVDSTQNFYIEVDEGLNATVYNSNYISKLDQLRDQMQSMIDSADGKLKTELQNAQNQLNSNVDTIKKTYNDLTIGFQNQFKQAQDSRAKSGTDALNKFNSDSSKAVSDFKTNSQNAINTFNSNGNKAVSDFKTNSDSKVNSNINNWSTQWQKAYSDFNNKLAQDQKSYEDTLKKLENQVNSDNATAQQISATLADLNKKVSDTSDQIAKLKANFNSTVFAKASDVYTKTESDANLKKLTDQVSQALSSYGEQAQQTEQSLETALAQALDEKQDKGDYATKAEVQSAVAKIAPSGLTDFNNLREPGIYDLSQINNFDKVANRPSNIDAYALMHVMKHRGNNGVQLIYNTNSNFACVRSWSSGGNTFTPWVQISNTTTYTNQDIDNKINSHQPNLSGINNNISTLQNQVKDLQTKVSSVSNKEYIHVATNETDAANYAKAHPDVVVILKGS